MPTLLLEGGGSAAAFREAAQALRQALPRSQTTVMPDQRHTAMDTVTDLLIAEALGFRA